MFDVAIIGTGPAGLSAALTLKLHNKEILWFGSREQSDKVGKSEKIANYPGVPMTSGKDLNAAFFKQAEEMGLEITDKIVSFVSLMNSATERSWQSTTKGKVRANIPTEESEPVMSLPFTMVPKRAFDEPVNLDRVYPKADVKRLAGVVPNERARSATCFTLDVRLLPTCPLAPLGSGTGSGIS